MKKLLMGLLVLSFMASVVPSAFAGVMDCKNVPGTESPKAGKCPSVECEIPGYENYPPVFIQMTYSGPSKAGVCSLNIQQSKELGTGSAS